MHGQKPVPARRHVAEREGPVLAALHDVIGIAVQIIAIFTEAVSPDVYAAGVILPKHPSRQAALIQMIAGGKGQGVGLGQGISPKVGHGRAHGDHIGAVGFQRSWKLHPQRPSLDAHLDLFAGIGCDEHRLFGNLGLNGFGKVEFHGRVQGHAQRLGGRQILHHPGRRPVLGTARRHALLGASGNQGDAE